MEPGRKKSSQTAMEQLAPYMGLGIQLAVSMAAFGALGWWLDGKWGTTPWLLAVGTLLGATGGMINIIRASNKASARPAGERGHREGDSPDLH